MPKECSAKTSGTLIKLHHHQPITYNVTIVNRIHGNQFIKIMLLDKIENEEDDHDDVLKPRYSIRHSTKIRVSQATGSLIADELAIQKRVSAEKMISPDSSTLLPNNNQSLLGSFLSPKENHSMLSPKEGTTRRLLLNEQEPKIADHYENDASYVSQAMSVFDEMQCQKILQENITNREGISTYREDHIFSSTRRYGDNQKLIEVGSPSTTFRKHDDELVKYQVDHHEDDHNNVLEVETVGSKVITAVFGIGGGSVSLDDHKKDPHATDQSRGITKEEVHDAIALKEKLRNLRHKMTKGIMEAVKAESVSSSYLSQGKKLQTMISRALITRTCHRSDRIFSYSFIVFVLIVLIFQILQALNIFRAVHKVKDEVSLLETGVFRVNALIILARYMRISTYVFQGYFSLFGNWAEDVAQSQQWIIDYTNNLNDYDNEFRVKLEDIHPSFQSAFYENNVKLYRRNESQALNYFTTSSNFQSVTLMLTKAFAAASADYSTGIDITSPEFADLNFVADNAYNSLLSSSEDTIYLLLDDLDNIVVQIKTKMLLLFGLLMGIAAVFIGFCIRYLLQMRSKAKIFMNMFFRLTSSEIHEAQDLLEHFKKCIDSNNIHEIEFVPKQEKAKNPEKNPEKNSGTSVKNNFREASMDKIHQKQILLLLRICPFFIMILALNIGYLILAYSTINQITEEQNQIGSSLSTLYSESLAVSLFVDMILTNATVTVRNGPIQEQFLYTIASIQNINEIVNDFRDSDGRLTTEQQSVFYDFPCSNIYNYDIQSSDTVYASCVEVAAGTDTMSLVGVTTGMVDAMKKVYTTFFASARTFNDIIDNFQLTIAAIQNYAFLFGPLCEILFDTTQQNFLKRTSSVQSQALIFTLVTCLWLIAGAIFCWFRTLISIFYFQDTDRIVLQLVPIRIILANRYLKQYLLKIANGTLERVKRFM